MEIDKMEKLNAIVDKYKGRVIVDNDFEHAYNIPFDAFETIDNKDLIELIFVKQAIIDEMNQGEKQ